MLSKPVIGIPPLLLKRHHKSEYLAASMAAFLSSFLVRLA